MKKGVIFLALSILLVPSVLAICGDHIPDGIENCETCPEDNPCLTDETCVNSYCVPKLIPPFFIKEDPSATVILPSKIADDLNELLLQPYEFVACLHGKYSEGVYQVTKMKIPEITAQGLYAVEHTKCSNFGLISSIHSHLDGNCELSKGDIFEFGKRKEPLMSIMCNENKFSFYSKADFQKSMPYTIMSIEPRTSNIWFIFPWVLSIILVASLIIVIYEREKIIKKRHKETALALVEKFTSGEKRIVDSLLLGGPIISGETAKKIVKKLVKNDILEVDKDQVRLKKWFRKAVKHL